MTNHESVPNHLTVVTTADSLLLHGLYFPEATSARRTAVLHVHGSYGNFFENFFLPTMAFAYTQAGVALWSIGTRGRDYYADFKKLRGEKYESVRIGGIREVFQDCVQDIRAWSEAARALGYEKIVLQGHSLGAMKAVFAVAQGLDVDGLVLLSPPDNFGLQARDFGQDWERFLPIAEGLVAADPHSLMPEEAYYDPISAAAFLSLLGRPGDTGMFTYADTALMRSAGMESVSCPLLATFATTGEAVVAPIAICEAAIRASVRSELADKVSVLTIDGANHNYHFREVQLAAAVAGWLDKNVS